MNDKNETSVGASPDQQAQQGALGVAPGSALPGDAGTWSIGDPNNPSRDDAMSHQGTAYEADVESGRTIPGID